MSEKYKGVQQRIEEIAPHTEYIHCYAHTLNLVRVGSTKSNQYANDFFILLESLYVFVSTFKVHSIFLEKQKELHPLCQFREIQKLSDTRWACQDSTINVSCFTYDSLLASLKEISE